MHPVKKQKESKTYNNSDKPSSNYNHHLKVPYI